MFTSLKEQSLYNALAGFCWGVGCILGPVIGGCICGQQCHMAMGILHQSGFSCCLGPNLHLLLPPLRSKSYSISEGKWKKVYWLGAFLMVTLICLFTIVLSFAGSTWRWQSGGSITLWVLFGLSLIAFSLQQTFTIFTTEEHRLFPVQFLKSRTLTLFYFGTAAGGTGLFLTIIF